MTQRIKTHFDDKIKGCTHDLGGWLQGKRTYLWFGAKNRCEGILSGTKLYRLAKAIVRQFEHDGRKAKR